MKDVTMRATLENLGVAAPFSRPRVSNDNPYAEPVLRTCKYEPDYPRKAFAMRSMRVGAAVRALIRPRSQAQRTEIRHTDAASLRCRYCRVGAARNRLCAGQGD